MKQFLRHIFLLLALFMATANVWAQEPVYNNGTWYSFYKSERFNIYTINSKEFSVFAPTDGKLTFDWEYDGWAFPSHTTKIFESSDNGGNYFEKGQVSGTKNGTGNVTLSTNINKIKFDRQVGNTNYVYYTNVEVPLAPHILFAEGTYGTTSTSISFDPVAIDGTSNVKEVKLRSFLTTGNITIKSNNDAFRIKTSTNTNGDVYAVGANACAASGGSDNAGGSHLGNIENYTVKIYFCPQTEGNITGTITLTDGKSIATISVSGTGLKKNQSIVWSDKFAADKPSIPVGKEVSDAATATSGLPVTYSSNNISIIAITNDGASFKALAPGTATITASQAGDEKWNSTSSTKTITVTEKKIQYIKWTDNLTRFKTGDAPFTMTATAHILVNVETEETQEVPERTALIKYTSANSNIVSVNGKVLTIVGAGETYVTATLEGDDTYERAEITMPVHVRNVTDGCERFVLDAPDEDKYSADTWGEYEVEEEISGPAGKLTFEAKKQYVLGVPGIQNVRVQQYVNGGWSTIEEIDPGKNYASYGPYDLDRNAKKIRFCTQNGSYYRYFKNVLVTQATYVEPFVNGQQLAINEVFVLPETAVGVPSENTFELNWSTCDDEGIFLEVDDPTKFKVQPTFISAQSVHYSKTPITVTCIDPSVANTDVTANIIITYDGNKTYTQPVKCHVKDKLETWLEYHGKDTYSEADGLVPNPFTLHDQGGVVLGAEIKLSSSKPEILSIVEENGESYLQAHCGGSVVISAEFAGSKKHKPCSTTVNITVPYCQREIIWETSYLNFATDENGHIDQRRELDATIFPESEITYQLHTVTSTPFAEIVEENGKHFVRVFGEGHGYIVATAKECSYEERMYDATYKIKEVRVSGAGVCDPNSLLIWGDGSDEPFVYQFSTNSSEQTRIYDLKGLPAEQMTFGAHAATASLNNILVISFSTESEGNNWIGEHRQEVVSGSSYNWNYSCPVPAGAKRVRFQSEASLTIYFNGVTIPQQTYIRPSVESIEISDATVNVPFERTFSVDYSNVRLLQWKVSNNHNLELKVIADQEVNNDCGMYGTYTFTLTGMSPYPQENATETITLYTSAGDEVKIPVIVTSHLSYRYDFNQKDGNWNDLSNWQVNGDTPATLPTPSNPVYIYKAVNIQDCEAIAYSITMVENGGHINVAPTGGLTVHAGGFTNANENNLLIHNTQQGAGFVRISKYFTHEVSGTMPRATINYQTRSTLDTGADKDATWQYFGAPGDGCQFTVDYITWLYQWSEPENWLEKSGTLTLAPFAGYAITQYGQPTYSLVAQPIHSNKDIVLTKTPSGMNGDNLFANSYMAPIDVKNFTAEDFSGDLDKTFYIFNSGSWNQWNRQNEKDSTLGSNGSTTPGQYCAIPALSAQYLDSKYDITTIPPMQGVYVIANEDNATIHLNYHKHVWQAGTYTGSSTDMHEAMRAPQRQAQEQMQQDDFRRLRLQINSANSGADRMYIIQESTTTRDYDNGYDAPNQLAEGIANIYTNEHFGKMEVSCSNNIDSIYIGFQAGIDSLYTLSYRSIIGPSIYLKDLSNDSTFLLVEGGQYQFTAQPLSTDDMRFQVLLSPILNDDTNNEGTTTDLSQLTSADIWFADNQLYISNAPANSTITLYNINGQLIVSSCIQQSTHTINLDNLQQGVYLLRLNHQMYKFVRQ